MPRDILLLDTQDGELRELGEAFAEAADPGCRLQSVVGLEELLARLGADWDLLLLDQKLGDGERSGLEVLREVRALRPDLPVIVVAEEGDVDTAAAAIEAGATDFLVRRHRIADRVTTQLRKIRQLLRLVDQNRRLSLENEQLRLAELNRYRMVGRSPQLTAVIESVRRFASIPRPCLIVGERGTGKELVARAIHEVSGATGPFVALNCGAIADSLLETELFGHERGAFTGADRRVPGKFELATGGTLFLDEIGSTSLPFQRKLLRVVEYGTFLRVGGTTEVSVSTRVVAATNADLGAMIERGEFLEDLRDRLSFAVIRVPPLRDRRGDVETLAQHFLEEFMREVPGFRGKRLSASALRALSRYPFPGNVRELKNIIERAVCRDTADTIGPEDLGLPEVRSRRRSGRSFKGQIEELELSLLREAVAASNGNQAEAARRLELSYHQFRYYVKKHGREALGL